MSEFEKFMKKNKKERKNVKYAATKSLCDDNGKPLEWEIKPVTSRVNEELRAECSHNGIIDLQKYRQKIMCASIVYPNLSDAALQDSYGVMNEEELLLEMVDNTKEFDELFLLINKISDTETLAEKVEESKN